MSERSLRLKSPAKVNLFLEVTGRRRDGYHTLRTLFVKIGLADDVGVRAAGRPGPVTLALKNRTRTEVPSGPGNLAVRAAEAFRKRFGITEGVHIELVKRIPAGGGLGGGSSIAGTVLRAMARLFPGPGRERALPALAAVLGADVALFAREGAAFLAAGIGERLKPVRLAPAAAPLVLVHPGVSVSTAEAYRKLALPRRKSVLTSKALLDKLVSRLARGQSPRAWSSCLFNRLEDPVLPGYPEVARAKRELSAAGASGVLMSGSGACVFAVAEGTAQARRLRRSLGRRRWTTWLARWPYPG